MGTGIRGVLFSGSASVFTKNDKTYTCIHAGMFLPCARALEHVILAVHIFTSELDHIRSYYIIFFPPRERLNRDVD